MPDLSSLIARLESATEGSAELSWQVAQSVGWTSYWAAYTIYLPPGEVEDDPRRADENWRSGATTEAPAFTTSIDAALSLVPEGWWPSFGRIVPEPGYERQYRARVDADATPFGYAGSKAPTPALALCICALRAREALS